MDPSWANGFVFALKGGLVESAMVVLVVDVISAPWGTRHETNKRGKLLHAFLTSQKKNVSMFFQIWCLIVPIGSMYGIFTYIWLIFMVNVRS